MYYLICLSRELTNLKNTFFRAFIGAPNRLSNDVLHPPSIKGSGELCRQPSHRQIAFMEEVYGHGLTIEGGDDDDEVKDTRRRRG